MKYRVKVYRLVHEEEIEAINESAAIDWIQLSPSIRFIDSDEIHFETEEINEERKQRCEKCKELKKSDNAGWVYGWICLDCRKHE